MKGIRHTTLGGQKLIADGKLLQLILLLRFGVTRPRRGDRPILSVVTVARVTRLSPSTVTRIIDRYLHTGDSGNNLAPRRWRRLLGHHVAYLTSQATLQAWAPLSLRERSVLFHR